MLDRLLRILGLGKPKFTKPAPHPKFVITAGCVDSLAASLEPERRKCHEGIAYLLGRTDGNMTLAVAAFRPVAHTTRGSFHIDPRAMARCVRKAADLGLQIVCQVHTHPQRAYHSDGDIEGARIRYAGYASIVLPDYGNHLPRFDGAALYFCDKSDSWIEMRAEDIVIVPNGVL